MSTDPVSPRTPAGSRPAALERRLSGFGAGFVDAGALPAPSTPRGSALLHLRASAERPDGVPDQRLTRRASLSWLGGGGSATPLASARIPPICRGDSLVAYASDAAVIAALSFE